MRVLYVSKALVVATYRAKLRALERHVEVRAVMPDRWRSAHRGASTSFEPTENGDGPPVETWPVLFPGHNHLHLYRQPEALLAGGPAPDLLHVDEEPYSAVTFQLLRRARRRGVPVVFFAWQNLAKRLPPPLGAMRAHVFRNAAGAIAGTRTAAEVLERWGWKGPLAVIPQFGVDPERFAPDAPAGRRVRDRIGAMEADLVVGFGGRLAGEKGVGVLLDAVATVSRSRLPGVRLLLLGDGPERGALEARAHRLGIRDRVHFAGHRPSLEMPRWLSACDVLVLPSVGRRGWVEQFGRILIEAMACGVPVVGSRSGEIPRVIGDAGIVVPPGDPGALAGTLRALADSEERRRDLAARGRARVLARYTHDEIALRTAEFYREVTP